MVCNDVMITKIQEGMKFNTVIQILHEHMYSKNMYL